MTRLLDPDAVLKSKIVEFVSKGEFGLASDRKVDDTYERLWFSELVSPDEVTFESQVFLLTKAKAIESTTIPDPIPDPQPDPDPIPDPVPEPTPDPPPQPDPEPDPVPTKRIFKLNGEIPPELWNRLGTKILPKLRSGSDLKIGIDFSVTIEEAFEKTFESDVQQILSDLELSEKVKWRRVGPS